MKKIISLIAVGCFSAMGQLPVIPFYAGLIVQPCIYSLDDQTSYTQGTNVNGENGGSCWTGAYVVVLL